MKWNIGLIIIMLLLVPAVSAQIVSGESQRIDMQECGFVTTGTVSCGQSVVLSCDVVDYTSSDYGVNTVTFTVNGQKHVVNDQNTGTPQNGSWALVLDIDESTADEVTVTTVSAQNSIGTQCSSENAADIDACLVRWNANPRNISTDCECTWSTSEEKFVDNTCIVTHTPSVGCEDAEYITNTYCDYCNPEWVVSLNECIPNREEVDPFYGVSQRRYTASDIVNACCQATGLASDCTPPADAGTEVVCRLDAWSGDGKNTYGTKTNNDQKLYESPIEVSQAFTAETIDAVTSNGQLERAIKPVAFDFNNDGEMEMVYFKANGFISYDVNFVEQQVESTAGVKWQGQPGLFGFNDVYHRAEAADPELTKTWLWAGDNYNQAGLCVNYEGFVAPNSCTQCSAQSTPYHEQVCCNVNPECVWNASAPAPTDLGRGFAGIVQDSSGDDHFVAYQSISGSFVKLTDINLQSTESTAAPGSGVSCWLDHCFFMDQNQRMWKVDVDAGTYVRKNVMFDENLETRPIDSLPVFVHSSSTGLVTGVVAETWSSSGSTGPGLAVCNVALTSCSVNIIGPSANASISRLVAAPYDNGLPGTPINFVLYDDVYNDGSLYEQYLVRSVVTPSLTFTNSGFKQLTGTGGVPSCVTDPVLGRCDSLGDYNIVVASHFEKETSTVVTLPSTPWNFNEQSNFASPLNGVDIEDDGAVGRTICSGDLCLMISGANLYTQNDPFDQEFNDVKLYTSVDGGPWSSVAYPSGFLDGSVLTTASRECYPIIRYSGGMNGVIYLITADPDVCWPQYGGLPTDRRTYYVDDYEIWKVTSDGLSKISDMDAQGQYPEGIVILSQDMAAPMECSPERCWVAITQGDGKRNDIFELKADETWDVHRPSAVSSVGPYNDLSVDTGAPSHTLYADDGAGDIYGYAKTSQAWYYALGSPLSRGSNNGAWPGYLVRVPFSDPGDVTILDSSTADVVTYIGLHADESEADSVWYTWMVDSRSSYWNQTGGGLLGDVAILDTGYDDFISNGTEFGSLPTSSNCWNSVSYDSRRHFREGQWILYNAVDGYPNIESAQTVKAKGSKWCEPCTSPRCWELAFGVDRLAPMTGGKDNNGKHYVQFNWVGVSPKGDGLSQQTQGATIYDPDSESWLMVMSESGIFSPVLTERDFRSVSVPRVKDDVLCDAYVDECIDNGCCWPTEVDVHSQGYAGRYNIMSPYNFGTVVRTVDTTPKSYFDKLTSGGATVVGGDYTYYSCYSPNYGSITNAFTELKSVIATEDICPSSIVTVDMDADNIDEVVSISGAYKYGSSKIFDPSIASTSLGVVSSFDLNADTYIDFSLVSSQIEHVVSAPEIPVAQGIEGEGTSVSSCSAVFDTVNSLVNVIPVGVSAENPTFLKYSAKLESTVGAGTIDSASGSTPVLSLRPLVGGQYNVQYTVTDQYKESQCVAVDGECPFSATVSCSVNVPQSAIAAPTTTSSCSLEPDGEFNYNDILGSDWFIIYGSGADTPTMVENEFVSMDDAVVKLAHSVDCADEAMLVEMRLRGVSSDTSILIVAESSSNDNIYQIGGVRLLGTELQAYGPDGAVTVVDLTAVGGWDVERFFTASMIFDFATQQYDVYVEGSSLLTLDFSNDVKGKVVAVEVDHQGGYTHIDYIRTGGQTGVDRIILGEDDNNRQYAFQALNTCINSSDRDWGEYPAGEYQVYPNIESYCDRRGENTGEKFCGQIDLIDAIHYNPGCYWEANNYCQYVTFPRTGGMLDDDVATKGGAGSLSGVMACTALLGTGATWSIVAEPTVNTMWTVFTNNLMVFLLIIGVIIILIPVFARRKR